MLHMISACKSIQEHKIGVSRIGFNWEALWRLEGVTIIDICFEKRLVCCHSSSMSGVIVTLDASGHNANVI